MLHLDIETNIISMMMLLTLYISLRRQTNRHEFINRIYLALIIFTMAILFFDSFQVAFDGYNTVLARIILEVSTFIYFALNPMIALIWVLYIDFHIFRSIKKVKRAIYAALPFLLTHLVFLILSISGNNYIYYIDQQNNYFRGPLLWITIVLTYGLIIAATTMVVMFRKRIRKDEILPLILFALPPAFAAIIQLLFQGLTIIWPSVTISILIIYIYIQSKLTTTDYLTGLFNRREYDNRVKMLDMHRSKNMKMSGLVVDIDNFKSINDDYGHSVGDQALIQMGNILKSSIRKDDFVARLGGDEFALMILNHDDQILKEIIDRIEKNLDLFNASDDQEYKLQVSIGYDTYDYDEFDTIEKFFIHLDHKMYQAKKEHKKK